MAVFISNKTNRVFQHRVIRIKGYTGCRISFRFRRVSRSETINEITVINKVVNYVNRTEIPGEMSGEEYLSWIKYKEERKFAELLI